MERLIAKDRLTGLGLVADASDPPRFYIQDRRRRELIAIGDESRARSRFATRLGHLTGPYRRGPRRPPGGSPAAPSAA